MLAPAVLFRDWVGAQARTTVVLATTLETPVLAGVVRALTGEPRAQETTVAGVDATVVRPAGEGPWPTLVFVNGADAEGRRNATVQRLARGLARAGYLTLVPDLPGLRDEALNERTVEGTVAVARAAADRGDAAAGRVGLVGVSTGASLALLAAEDPALASRVSVVAGVAPYADLKEVIRIATTGTYRHGGRIGRVRADPFLLAVVARSLGLSIPEGPDRDGFLAAMTAVENGEPRAGAASVAALGPQGRAVGALVINRDPAAFERLYGALAPDVRARLERLSPLAGRGRIAAPVELASGPRDRYFPISESRAIGRIAPRLRVTVTEALDHADLVPSLRDVPHLARLDGFVARSLRFAAG